MNELLFRQALFLNGKFHQWHYWGLIDGAFVGIATGDWSPIEAIKNSQMSTGLLDKNKVKIYEGDIVQWHTWDGYVGSSPVEFRDGLFYPVASGCLEYERFDKDKGIKIIGNIYEYKES